MRTIGRYEVVRPLGRGGMGQVFLARDPKLERSVALKLLKRETDSPDARVLFEREAKALAALSHPNIVTIYEIAEHEGQQFIAMEYLPGKSLRELLLTDRPSRDRLVAICADVATALVAAHAAGILHRDIKPENVVVGDQGAVKVVDFGIARQLGRSSLHEIKSKKEIAARAAALVDAFTQTVPIGDDTIATTAPQATGVTAATNTIFGTPAYMAPEVLMGEPSSPASDVYSLGVMLYECLTGRRPYDAPELHVMIARAIDGEEPPTRPVDPLGALVEAMLDRDPAKRPTPAALVKLLARRAPTVAASSRRRWLVPLVASVALAAGALVVWQTRGTGEPDVAPAIDRGPIAIQIIKLESFGFAPNPPDQTTIARVLSDLLEQAGLTVVGPAALLERVVNRDSNAEWEDAARTQPRPANLLARGTIVERGKQLIGTFEIVDLRTRTPVKKFEVPADIANSAPLLADATEQIVSYVKPGAAGRAKNPTYANRFFEKGVEKLQVLDWGAARIYLEQAVAHDPSFTRGWEELANALERNGMRETTIVALQRAIAQTPASPRRHIRLAALHVHKQEYAAAFTELARVEHVTLSPRDELDRMLWLGEAHWHEGRHDRGYEYFVQIIEKDPSSVQALQHAGEYAIARRMDAPARRYLGLQKMHEGHIRFALRQYDELARSTHPYFRHSARVVLDDPSTHRPSSDLPRIAIGEKIAIAAEADDRATLAREVPALLELVRSDLGTVTSAELVLAIEVTLSGGYADHVRDLLAALRHVDSTYQYRRLAILAGPLIGRPSFPREVLTERLAQLSDAVDAELAGNHARAAELLGALVANPTWEWEYPERVALLRNLRALGRTADAVAICRDTLEPAVMRNAYRAVRRVCGAMGVRRRR